jgi:hypothetical protein
LQTVLEVLIFRQIDFIHAISAQFNTLMNKSLKLVDFMFHVVEDLYILIILIPDIRVEMIRRIM